MATIHRSLISATIAVTLLTGCASSTFSAAVGHFGTQSEAAMKEQAAQLKLVTAAETERIRADLADQRADLRLRDCDLPPTDDGPINACRVIRLEPNGTTTEIEQPIQAANIVALESALAGYGKNLALLAADSSQDQAAFTASLTGLAGSLGTLDGAIVKVAGGSRRVTDDKLSAIAGIIAKVGNLAFAFQRQRALKRIIVETNPLIAEAVYFLNAADTSIVDFDLSYARASVRTAQRKVAEVSHNRASTHTQVRKAQDDLYRAVDAYNVILNRKRQVRELGAVHAALADVARPGASREQLASALERLVKWNVQFEN